MLLMLVGMSAWAQNWEAPTESEYHAATVIHAQVKVNGVEQTSDIEVAAFIDSECRAVSTTATRTGSGVYVYSLRVVGDTDANSENNDLNKEITFKAYYNGLVFAFTKKVTFVGDATYDNEMPLVLNIDCPTGVTLPNPLKIETQLNNTYDLTNDVTFTYQGQDDSGAFVNYTPLNESEIETKLTYTWDFSNSSAYFTIGDNNILTALKETDETGAYLTLAVSNGSNFRIGGFTYVVITEPEVQVTDISCSSDEITIPISQSLYEQKDFLVNITPADASNKKYYFEGNDDNANSAYEKESGTFSNTGLYSMKVVSESNPNVFATFQVNVVRPVTGLSLKETTFYAIVGDNINELVKSSVQITPEDATNQNFYIEYPNEDAFTNDVAYTPGQYSIKVVSSDNSEYYQEATLYVIAISAPETWEMEVGDNYDTDLLRDQITIVPQEVTYTIIPKEADGAAFADGMALQAGEYTLVVTCHEYSRATAEIKVTVKEPVVITYPASLTISKLKDTELELAITSGEEYFDADLLNIWIEEGENIGGSSKPTITEVESSNGLKWNIRGYAVGKYNAYITYNGKLMNNVEGERGLSLALPVEILFNPTGWDWIYYPSVLRLKNADDGSYLTWLNNGANRVIEIRSQTELLYNDATLGIFGSLDVLTHEAGMYKIKADYADADDAVIIGSDDECNWNRYPEKAIVKGYNWIGYPNEWEMTVADLNTLENNTAYDGDMIIGKTGFAEYDATSGGWVAENGFTFQVGKGYLYYCTDENGISNGFSFDFIPESGTEEIYQTMALSTQKVSAESVWQYDAGQFADNMAIVAEIPQLDFPADYTVGAFVGDECRGKGSAVLGGKMMISVAGKAGERVTFRLHNELTGEFFDLNETLTYAQRAGSLKNPVVLTSNGIATGIAEVEASDNAVEGIFDLSGRRVENMNAGGIYFIKTFENGKIVARKVIK